MSRLSTHEWSVSQLLEEWNYHYMERLGMLCEDREPEPWMIQLAEKDAKAAVERITQPPKAPTQMPLGGCLMKYER